MTVLYLIVARGGSKRIPGKNMRMIQGISLVRYKCCAAKASRYATDIMISTDSPQIAEEARHAGVMVPFMRPDELATDEATTEDVVRHTIAWWEDRNMQFDAIQLLEPSSPFVRPSDYDAACELVLIGKDVQFVCGSVLYLFRWEYLCNRYDLYDNPQGRIDYDMPKEYALDIDTMEDLYQAHQVATTLDLSWATP